MKDYYICFPRLHDGSSYNGYYSKYNNILKCTKKYRILKTKVEKYFTNFSIEEGLYEGSFSTTSIKTNEKITNFFNMMNAVKLYLKNTNKMSQKKCNNLTGRLYINHYCNENLNNILKNKLLDGKHWMEHPLFGSYLIVDDIDGLTLLRLSDGNAELTKTYLNKDEYNPPVIYHFDKDDFAHINKLSKNITNNLYAIQYIADYVKSVFVELTMTHELSNNHLNKLKDVVSSNDFSMILDQYMAYSSNKIDLTIMVENTNKIVQQTIITQVEELVDYLNDSQYTSLSSHRY